LLPRLHPPHILSYLPRLVLELAVGLCERPRRQSVSCEAFERWRKSSGDSGERKCRAVRSSKGRSVLAVESSS